MERNNDDSNKPQTQPNLTATKSIIVKQSHILGPSTSIPTTQTVGTLSKESPSQILNISLSEALEESKKQMLEQINTAAAKSTQKGMDDDDNEATSRQHIGHMIDQMIEAYTFSKSDTKIEENAMLPQSSISLESIRSENSKLSTATTLRLDVDLPHRVTFLSPIPDIFEEPPTGSSYCVGQRRNELDSRSDSTSRTFPTNSNIIYNSPEGSPTTSIRSIGSLICRICHNAEDPERLVSPCLCKGSLAYVHVHCLERWIATSQNTSCELCHFRYNTEQTLRFTCIQSLRMWYSRALSRRALQEDCQMFSLLTLVAFGIMGTLVVGIQYYAVKETNMLGMNHVWTKTWLFMCILITLGVYIINIYMILKQQLVPWFHWWQSARDIRLILENRRPFTLRPSQRTAHRPLLSNVTLTMREANDGGDNNNNNNNNSTEENISNPFVSSTMPELSVAALLQPFSDVDFDGDMSIVIDPIYYNDNSESELKSHKTDTNSMVLNILNCEHCEV